MYIFVCCAGGGSSSLFCARLAKAINETDENLTASFDTVDAVLSASPFAPAADLVFAYGAVDAIRPATAYDFGSRFDVVLVAPQVRYLTAAKQAVLADYPTVVADMDRRVFGLMDGNRGYQELLDQLLTLDLMRGFQSGLGFASKRGDKDLELLVVGASRSDRAMRNLTAALLAAGIRTVQERFTIDGLYDFHPQNEFEVRLMFGARLTPELIPKVARRIDGVIRFTDHASAEPTWDQRYRLPGVRLSPALLKDHADPIALCDAVMAFLLDADAVAQGTSEVHSAFFETPPPPKQVKSFLGLFTYTV
ncbi:PTS sugar transporter subunit IIB [Lacticaseibacillus parakribbianus]|uniref:PTS sugar transporter subunit IIB n=1 Tax=Lacticaseibacillus parakribbianus TaxID=2970927 RepID=UPI0021CB5157|nr:hypothetical protein [Lacticaseibacillus parakribbianus]